MSSVTIQQLPKLLIGVLSAEKYHARRQACRETWANCAAYEQVDLVFLIGDPQASLPYREADVLYCPCPDSYESLPQKTRWFCLWALASSPFDFLFKCDDDTYVAVERLLAILPSADYVGHDIGGYASGGAGYLLSREAAMTVAGRMTAATGAEDWLASQALFCAKIPFVADSRFHAWNNRVPQTDNDQITTHYCKAQLLHRIHRRLCNNSPPSSIFRRLWAKHPHWEGEIVLFDDGAMARPGGDQGTYELEEGVELSLHWDSWPTELLNWDKETETFNCADKAFTLRYLSVAAQE
ncbi:hypothetical protein [Blastopirellula marina]|uniref:Hexosyltransferase n=1 Tax=Blastopirellula marina TaxID=124 RepID=A0A2S8GHL7_9BACT|nr:hypothetical protein [Blastopirellula marina]PQO43821.1 hypothetical protein C5Y93_21790 [Blastopirellula marina]